MIEIVFSTNAYVLWGTSTPRPHLAYVSIGKTVAPAAPEYNVKRYARLCLCLNVPRHRIANETLQKRIPNKWKIDTHDFVFAKISGGFCRAHTSTQTQWSKKKWTRRNVGQRLKEATKCETSANKHSVTIK